MSVLHHRSRMDQYRGVRCCQSYTTEGGWISIEGCAVVSIEGCTVVSPTPQKEGGSVQRGALLPVLHHRMRVDQHRVVC